MSGETPAGTETEDARYARYGRAFHGFPRPFAYVDLELLERNADALVARAGGRPLRVATKSIRSVEVLKRVLARPGFAGALAYRGTEAAFLAEKGVRDVVVAYPAVDDFEIGAVVGALQSGAEITLMVDRPEHLALIARTAQFGAPIVPIALDLDLATRFPGLFFGVRRSWLSAADHLEKLLADLATQSAVRFDGVVGYEAQIAGVDDASAFVRFLKGRAWRGIVAKRAEFVARIRAAGLEPRFVNGGGTGSLERTREDPTVTELTAGSGLFGPTAFDGYRGFRPEPAAGFALAVTRKPERQVATCHGGGYVASGPAGPEKLPTPFLPADLSLFPREGAGEVQTPVGGPGAGALKIGDSVFFRHAKAGELCERFDQLLLVRGERVEEIVPTYRGDGKNFG